MKKVLLIALAVLAVALLLSSCSKVLLPTGITSIREAITSAGTATTNATVVGVVTKGYGDYVIIQDDTAAIEVYLKGSKFATTYATGDKIKVAGKVELYKNNWEITPASTSDVSKIGTGNVSAILIPTNLGLSVDYDWMLMKVENLSVKKTSDKYYNVILSNGSTDVTIYSYDSNVRTWLTSLATGDEVSAQGLVQYVYGWKLVLRDINDKLK